MGVSCFLPPSGMRTVFAPIVESNRSSSPFWLQIFRSESSASRVCLKSSACAAAGSSNMPLVSELATSALAYCVAPLVLRNSRSISTMVWPFQSMRILPLSVTTATTVASKFSLSASASTFSTSPAATTTAMRSWDSEIAISVPSRPSYFLGTLSRSISRLSASSPMATQTPPAPKSLQRLTSRVKSGLRNSRCNLRSVSGLPFCTSAPHSAVDFSSCALLLPVTRMAWYT